ncbi:hypothetical protein K438DRAFT_1877144 [Mycena galopus ATCC 62051]|nr:hypothetical protein K438DRAFT_1877144 [Mycena galopus ATCC 62051]
MTLALKFLTKHLLESAIIGPDDAVHYHTTSTRGFGGRKTTTITAASGLQFVGVINWREHTFEINGVKRRWDEIRTHLNKSAYEWYWDTIGKPYRLEYDESFKELLATPTTDDPASVVRFVPFHHHLFHLHETERAHIYFPESMQDEQERIFLLMVILQTDTERQDANAEVGAAYAGS